MLDAEPGASPGLRRLGPYFVERRIGGGSMGAVYLALDPQTDRPLAIKTLALGREFGGAALEEARLRFMREAQTAGRLAHPDIVSILGCGEEQGLAWIAMEYLPGRDLAHHALPGSFLPVPTLLRVASRVADALAYAHRQGVVHRDVKPANVMIDLATGSVKVTDFGIARIADGSRTRTGMVLGTPSFMSPEQMTGRRIDGRSDIYSLGVMLFQLLCGQLPHRADSMAALMSQIVNQRAPDIRSLRPELPAALADLVALTLEKRPELRHADGRQLALDLKLIATRMDGTSEPAPPPAMRREVDPFASTVKFSRDDPRHNPGE
jgi:eukaryotic-like serine/threonine-protein kinase